MDAGQHLISRYVDAIHEQAAKLARAVRLMEVCGTHTMSAFRSGLRSLLPETVQLLSGPGCPVCVTPGRYVDQAIAIASQPGTLVATFGDMLRVPGTHRSLEEARAAGARVSVVYSPLDAVEKARRSPGVRVVFLGIGFETTAPTVAWALREARSKGMANFAVLCAHKTIPEAMAALLSDPAVAVDGYLCPGHVSVIIGADAYRPIAEQYGAPCVVTGFEAADMAEGIAMLLAQLADGRSDVENPYSRSVTRDGNAEALAAIHEVFEPCDSHWRGLGLIPDSGLRIRDAYAAHDAGRLFADLEIPAAAEPAGCRCGDILKGLCLPTDCPLFGTACTHETPVGACMVSSEGTCAAYYRYGRQP